MLRYVTSNPGKAEEAAAYLGESVEPVDFDYVERQADSLEAIARAGAETAFEELPGDDPIIVDDAGLFINAFEGFPGPYSAYVEGTLGIERVATLTLAESDRSAYFEAVIAFTDGATVETFSGRCHGEIVSPRGDGGFGYDPIFAHGERTLAEMSVDEKNAMSHRGRALEGFAEWYADHDS